MAGLRRLRGRVLSGALRRIARPIVHAWLRDVKADEFTFRVDDDYSSRLVTREQWFKMMERR